MKLRQQNHLHHQLKRSITGVTQHVPSRIIKPLVSIHFLLFFYLLNKHMSTLLCSTCCFCCSSSSAVCSLGSRIVTMGVAGSSNVRALMQLHYSIESSRVAAAASRCGQMDMCWCISPEEMHLEDSQSTWSAIWYSISAFVWMICDT